MAARIVIQMLANATTILGKAFFSAYQQALRNAKAGGAPNPSAASGRMQKFKMPPDEAMKILDINISAFDKKLLDERFKRLFEANDPNKGGSFYIQSKVYRAKEVLDYELLPDKEKNEKKQE